MVGQDMPSPAAPPPRRRRQAKGDDNSNPAVRGCMSVLLGGEEMTHAIPRRGNVEASLITDEQVLLPITRPYRKCLWAAALRPSQTFPRPAMFCKADVEFSNTQVARRCSRIG